MERDQPILLPMRLLPIICLFVSYAYSQQAAHTAYFEKDKYHLTSEELLRLDSLMKLFPEEGITGIYLSGHTDSDASDEYNLELSQHRVETVHRYLSGKGFEDSLFREEVLGERQPAADNATREGMKKNRRVEIRVTMRHTPPPPPCAGVIPPCSRDTTIVLPEGTRYTVNVCDTSCVKIRELMSGDVLAREHMTTMSEQHERLISGGMLNYSICDSLEVNVLVPVRENCDGENMRLWKLNDKGRWEQVGTQTVPVVSVAGRRYYSLPLSGLGSCNLDKLPPPVIPPKVVFVASRRSGIRLHSVTLYCDCPLSAEMRTSRRNKMRKVVLTRTCCENAHVMIEASTAEGKSLDFGYRKVSELKGKNSLGSCRTTVRRKWWFFRTWNKSMYRKYKVRREYFAN